MTTDQHTPESLRERLNASLEDATGSASPFVLKRVVDLETLTEDAIAALEAAEAKRDALAAHVERLERVVENAPCKATDGGMVWQHDAPPTDPCARCDVLAASPAQSLAERDARVRAEALEEAERLVEAHGCNALFAKGEDGSEECGERLTRAIRALRDEGVD